MHHVYAPSLCGQTSASRAGSASAVDDNSEGCKHFGNLRANLALRGYRLHELSDGYLIARWNLTKHVPDLRAVVQFLRQIGGTV